MIHAEYKFKLGEDEFTIKAEVKSEKEWFERMAFFASLPKVGPNGETDLKLTYRCVGDDYEYYSIVSKDAGQEFTIGQYKGDAGSLFAKTWQPLYQKDGEQGAEQSGSRFEKPERSDAKPAQNNSRFSKPAAKAPAPTQEPQGGEDDQSDAQADDAQQAAGPEDQPQSLPPAAKQPAKAPAAPAPKSTMADLMAKYGGAKGPAQPNNLRR